MQWTVCAVLLVLAHAQAATKQKRQIFREQVSPHSGGKIPEDAFRTDRLALNRLNKEGIAVPDGILLEARHKESHHTSHRNDPSISASIIKLVQHSDGRYTPPEGHYPFDNLLESTYIVRPPWGHINSIVIPPHRTLEVPLTIPHRPSYSFSPTDDHNLGSSPFANVDELLSFNALDGFYNSDMDSTRVWPGLRLVDQLFHDTPARFLRQTARKPTSQYPGLTSIPKTSFDCGSAKGKMIPDREANCQVFHLCHTTGQRESFLCPKGMRFDPRSSQCSLWTKVSCEPEVRRRR